MPIKDKTLRACLDCDAVWRGAVFCPFCDEPTGEPIEETPADVYLEVMLALLPDDTRHDN